MKKHILLVIGFVIVLLGAFAGLYEQKQASSVAEGEYEPCRDFSEGVVTIGASEIFVDIARSEEEQILGLGGCTALLDGEGVYFPYPEKETPSFWMKGMVIPIDIIWIADGVVVGIEGNVSPEPGVLDEDLVLLTAPQPVDGVLEIAAGSSRARGIEPGNEVTLSGLTF